MEIVCTRANQMATSDGEVPGLVVTAPGSATQAKGDVAIRGVFGGGHTARRLKVPAASARNNKLTQALMRADVGS